MSGLRIAPHRDRVRQLGYKPAAVGTSDVDPMLAEKPPPRAISDMHEQGRREGRGLACQS